MLKVFSRAFEFGKNYIWDRLLLLGGKMMVGVYERAGDLYTLILNERISPLLSSPPCLSVSSVVLSDEVCL